MKNDSPFKHKIPFNRRGELDPYGEIWKDNSQWEDSMEFVEVEKTQYAHAIFRSEKTGKQYPMFISDFNKIVPSLRKGRVSGTFTFRKSGNNVAIQLL
jgi:hypothetical protein